MIIYKISIVTISNLLKSMSSNLPLIFATLSIASSKTALFYYIYVKLRGFLLLYQYAIVSYHFIILFSYQNKCNITEGGKAYQPI